MAGVEAGDVVLEVGPGLGSLTLALLEAGAVVCAVEIDPILANALPLTIEKRMPEAAERLAVANIDAMDVEGPANLSIPPCLPGSALPSRLVANLPYNVAVPVLLGLLEALPSLQSATVMVQAEVADRLAAVPGSRIYGVPSAKVSWYGAAKRGPKIARSVFWPVPNVDSALVSFTRYDRFTKRCAFTDHNSSREYDELLRRDKPKEGDELTRHDELTQHGGPVLNVEERGEFGECCSFSPLSDREEREVTRSNDLVTAGDVLRPGRSDVFGRGAFDVSREDVFAVIDAAFAQRRKTLRAALASWAGSATRAEAVLVAAGIDPSKRGEQLSVDEFVAITQAARGVHGDEWQ